LHVGTIRRNEVLQLASLMAVVNEKKKKNVFKKENCVNVGNMELVEKWWRWQRSWSQADNNNKRWCLFQFLRCPLSPTVTSQNVLLSLAPHSQTKPNQWYK